MGVHRGPRLVRLNPMALSNKQEWILVACGLIAHADGVMDGEECGRLMNWLDDGLDDGDYTEWLVKLGDKLELQVKLAELQPLDEADREVVLREAWGMAMVDGERCDAELRVLGQIAEQLGMDRETLEAAQAQWVEEEKVFARAVAGAAAGVLGGGDPLGDDAVEVFKSVLLALPTVDAEREVLAGLAKAPPGEDAVLADLQVMPGPVVGRALRVVASYAVDHRIGPAARARFEALAGALGFSAEQVSAMLGSRAA